MLIVVLQNAITSNLGGAGAADGLGGAALTGAARERAAEPIAAAFAHTYWWAFGLTLLALIPATLLGREERRARKARDADAGADARQPAGRAQPPAAIPGSTRVTVASPSRLTPARQASRRARSEFVQAS